MLTDLFIYYQYDYGNMSTIPKLDRIALQNISSKNITFDDLARLVPALQTQVDRDFAPMWGVRAQIIALNQDDKIPGGVWPIFLIDPSDEPGGQGLGVHLDPNGKPVAYVTDAGYDDGSWTITASHELLEMLADPFGNRLMAGPDMDPNSDKHGVNYLVEVGDPCETFSYTINNVKVTDFVTVDYYHAQIKNGVYDFLHHLSQPLQVPPRGCYISWEDPDDGHWHQKTPADEFVTGGEIDTKKNPREDRDKSFGEEEEERRHDLHRILTASPPKKGKIKS